MLDNAIARLILWGRKSGVALEPVELSGGVTAARLAADLGDPARVALLHHISASRGAYEYERRRGGEWRPNRREEWLDVQARALYQASRLICRAAEGVTL